MTGENRDSWGEYVPPEESYQWFFDRYIERYIWPKQGINLWNYPKWINRKGKSK